MGSNMAGVILGNSGKSDSVRAPRRDGFASSGPHAARRTLGDYELTRACPHSHRADSPALRPAPGVAVLLGVGLLPQRRDFPDRSGYRPGAAVRKERCDAAVSRTGVVAANKQ